MGLQERFGANLNARKWRQLFWRATEVCRLQHGIEWAPEDGSGSGIRIRADAARTVTRAYNWERKGRRACIRSAERYDAVAAATTDQSPSGGSRSLRVRARAACGFYPSWKCSVWLGRARPYSAPRKRLAWQGGQEASISTRIAIASTPSSSARNPGRGPAIRPGRHLAEPDGLRRPDQAPLRTRTRQP